MKHFCGSVYRWSLAFGLDPIKLARALRALPSFFHDLRAYRREVSNGGELGVCERFRLGALRPHLDDKVAASGQASGHYFHQDLLVARKIFLHAPERHIDIGSRIDGFVAHLATFRNVEVFDIRAMDARIPNVEFTQLDLMEAVEEPFVGSTDSLSCLHALEHFGLGRYGDPISPLGHQRAFANMARLVRSGGKFYFSVPMGPQRIEFNAHRVFSLRTLVEMCAKDYLIDSFSYVDDLGALIDHATMTETAIDSNFGCMGGCAIFELTRK